MMKPGWLVHPTKGTSCCGIRGGNLLKCGKDMLNSWLIGPAFPIGEGDRLGAMRKPHDGPHLAGSGEHEGH